MFTVLLLRLATTDAMDTVLVLTRILASVMLATREKTVLTLLTKNGLVNREVAIGLMVCAMASVSARNSLQEKDAKTILALTATLKDACTVHLEIRATSVKDATSLSKDNASIVAPTDITVMMENAKNVHSHAETASPKTYALNVKKAVTYALSPIHRNAFAAKIVSTYIQIQMR